MQSMADSMDDFTLPQKTVNQIIKSSLPRDVKVSEEVKRAVARSTTMYILSVAATAQTVYKAQELTGDMIIQTIADMGFPAFQEPLRRLSEELHKKPKPKPRIKKKVKKAVETGNTSPKE